VLIREVSNNQKQFEERQPKRHEKEELDQTKRERKDKFSCVEHTCDRSERAKSEPTASPGSTSIGFSYSGKIPEKRTGERREQSMNKENFFGGSTLTEDCESVHFFKKVFTSQKFLNRTKNR
jgi:hypothetical protein